MNNVNIIGNLTRDPEVSTTASGITFARMSIAVNRNYTNASGEREADFFNIIAWRGTAENAAKYLTKGSKIGVSGNLQSRSYESSDGQNRYVVEIVADQITYTTAANKDNSEQSKSLAKATKTKTPVQTRMGEMRPVDDDELPF